jgi:hypothetical protein
MPGMAGCPMVGEMGTSPALLEQAGDTPRGRGRESERRAALAGHHIQRSLVLSFKAVSLWDRDELGLARSRTITKYEESTAIRGSFV